jgi:mRNA interferase RelE/StbE
MVRKIRNFVYPQLREHPHFGPNIRKLKDFEPETWRYRIGAWRFFYEIDEDEKIVFMIAASHRSSSY